MTDRVVLLAFARALRAAAEELERALVELPSGRRPRVPSPPPEPVSEIDAARSRAILRRKGIPCLPT